MNTKEMLPVFVVTGLLLVNCILIFFSDAITIINIISLIGPVLIMWMVYCVLRFGNYKGPELKDEEEWGYADKNKDDLGVF